MNEKKDITVAFTGHRTYQAEAEEALQECVKKLYERGFRRFLVGMAWGFDLAAGEAVAALKEQYGDVELVAVVPVGGFRNLFHDAELALYDGVLQAADECVVVSEKGSPLSYVRRNDFLVDNASLVVAWWSGSRKGGTAYTVKRAFKKGREVINLLPPSQMSLFED